MKILQIGAGGIGSWLLPEMADCIDNWQMDVLTEIFVADEDIVEIEQLGYQNFGTSEAGTNKAKALAKSHEGVTAIPERIRSEKQLAGYDVIILCVDNDRTRELVIRYCHAHGVEFLDLRATGRRIFAMPKESSLDGNLRFVDGNDNREYSCQDRADLKKGYIQKGNKIVAMIGIQMLLNLLRGHGNKPINEVI